MSDTTYHALATGKHLELRRAINALTLIGLDPDAVRTLHDAADALAAENAALRSDLARWQRVHSAEANKHHQTGAQLDRERSLNRRLRHENAALRAQVGQLADLLRMAGQLYNIPDHALEAMIEKAMTVSDD